MTTQTDSSIVRYLQSHRNGVVATTNRTGTPQQTLITYHFDGKDIVFSTRGDRLKAKNISVRPNVSLAVIDGGAQLIVYGNARIVRDPDEVFRLHAERIRPLARQPETDAELAGRLKRENRVVIVLTPQRFYPTSL
jgi:PPOX class probable F420-dependent enzyme